MRNAILTIAALTALLGFPATLSAQTYGETTSPRPSALDLTVTAYPLASPGFAPRANTWVMTQVWVEEWDEASQSWVRVSHSTSRPYRHHFGHHSGHHSRHQGVGAHVHSAERFYAPHFAPETTPALAQYGPFKMVSDTKAEIIGATDSYTEHYFDMMLADFPALGTIEFVEAPGTSDDVANLNTARKIREAGITTHVPNGGSVRSGAVELFLAGARRRIDDGAEFAVHSWRDTNGLEPRDYAPDSPENRLYLDFYKEMGMSEERARNFYDMTNSVPHASALWLDADDMRAWTDYGTDYGPDYRRVSDTGAGVAEELAPQWEAVPAGGALQWPFAAPRLPYEDVSQLDLDLLLP